MHEDRLVNCKQARQCSKFWISKKKSLRSLPFPQRALGSQRGSNSQGTFLATISILSSISDQFSRAYSTILDLQDFCAPMKKLTVSSLSSRLIFRRKCVLFEGWQPSNSFKYVRFLHLQKDNRMFFFQSLGATRCISTKKPICSCGRKWSLHWNWKPPGREHSGKLLVFVPIVLVLPRYCDWAVSGFLGFCGHRFLRATWSNTKILRNRQRRENTKKERDALLADPKPETPGVADPPAGGYKTDLIPIRTVAAWGCGARGWIHMEGRFKMI